MHNVWSKDRGYQRNNKITRANDDQDSAQTPKWNNAYTADLGIPAPATSFLTGNPTRRSKAYARSTPSSQSLSLPRERK